MDSLIYLFKSQRQIAGYLAHNFSTMTPTDRLDYIRHTILALTHELHEFLSELNWKPWATDTPPNGPLLKHTRTAAVEELADCLAFFVNLCLSLGVSEQELINAYQAERLTNQQRFTEGRSNYD